MGLNSDHFRSGELVHSQRPPSSPCPAKQLPLAVTGTGCQCWKPMLAPSRSIKRSLWSPSTAGFPAARDGGVSWTPLLLR